ncbi:pentatricopeptide repeat-containing protein At5g66520-like [Telopea speciosissima]|uniref:pentatricopeptide repeat-containing protein At5g66520-like n=1 Tax=Telopea speciosissima TaxID=54955 RepID=UPI001CC5C1E0|nr:pentatricopeptide repeat-containing protein At5g66520-like [Telopea speciosissima]
MRKSILSLLEASFNRSIDLKALHGHTITSGLIRDPFVASRLVEFCFKSGRGDPQYARVIFHSLDLPDVYTWNAMIIGHAERDSPKSGVSYYFQMLARRVPPDNYTFALVVKACMMGSCEDNELGRKIHGQILKQGMEDLVVVRNSLMNMYCKMGQLEVACLLFDESLNLDLVSWNSMISAYGKHGNVEAARELFDKMPQRTLVSWSAMIDGYVKSGSFVEALRLFSEMQALGVKPDVVTLVTVLKACANLGALDQGRWVHLYIDRNKLGWERNVVLGTALVDMYAKCGCIDVAFELFDGIHIKDAILWNAMIGGLAMHGHGWEALEIFSRMRRHGMMLNETTFLTVISACAHSGMAAEGVEIFESMKREYGIEPKVEHYGCLADLLGRAGLVHEAEEVLCNMPMEPLASQWGALMAACRTHNNVEVGERVGKRLILMEPLDGGRYVLLSNIYAAAGRWEDARKTRRAMEDIGAKKETGCSFIELDGNIHEFIVGDTNHPQSREIYGMLGELKRELKMVGTE